MYDDDGNQVYEPDDARRFFATPENLLVSIVDAGDNKSIRLYIGSSTDVADVLGLDQTLRSTATKYNMLFNLKRQAHDLTVQDFATRASVTESQGDNTMDLLEGMYGTTKSSYLKLENAKMIVRHSKKIDENIMGSRGRHIDAIFVENSQGERFLFPTRQMSPARAMTQHVNQGGSWADEIGSQINRMAQDYSALATGSSYIGANAMSLSEGATALRENIRESMREMRKCFERLSRSGAYVAECKKIQERANMVIEGDVEGCMTADEIKESLFVEGVDLDEGVVNAIAEALRSKKVGQLDEEIHEWENEPDDGHTHDYSIVPDDDMGVENAMMCSKCGEITSVDYDDDQELEEEQSDDLKMQNAAKNGFIISVGDRYVGTSGLVDEKNEATTFPTAVRAAAYADRHGVKGYDIAQQHSKTENPVPEMTRVCGRPVSVAAWDAFKAGKLDLVGPVSSQNQPRFAPGAADAMLAFKVGEIVPLVKDDSMLNLLSYVSERVNDDHASDKEKAGLRAVAQHAINIAYPKNESFTTKAEPIREFAEWINGFAASRFLAETTELVNEMEDDEDHRDAVIHKESEIDYVMKHFDPATFLKYAASDLNWYPEEEDPSSLHVEDRTFDKSYVMSILSHYLSKQLEKNCGVEDEDMTREAETVYDKVAALMTGASYVINETDDLNRDDAVIPNDQGDDFENDVSARGFDSMDIERLRTLAGRK